MAVFTPSVTVAALLPDARPGGSPLFPVEVLGGELGLGRPILYPSIQKTGLALAGFDEYLQGGRVLVFGESEIRFLESLAPATRVEALGRTLRDDIPCVLITNGLEPVPELVAGGNRARMPILRTTSPAPVAINRLIALLEDWLAPRELIHGVLLDVLGLGVLITGESGIGKSECALDLVVRGHRLVADDAIEIRRRGESVVIGTAPDLTRHHMELRGIGLINLRDMFGVSSTRGAKRVELVVQLERWDTGRDYERLGIDDSHQEVLGVSVPLVRMPVAPGRNLAILVEVAARNQLLRARGQHAARDLAARLERQLAGNPEASSGDTWADGEEEP
jgi:HPr kinase/phosphorylase